MGGLPRPDLTPPCFVGGGTYCLPYYTSLLPIASARLLCTFSPSSVFHSRSWFFRLLPQFVHVAGCIALVLRCRPPSRSQLDSWQAARHRHYKCRILDVLEQLLRRFNGSLSRSLRQVPPSQTLPLFPLTRSRHRHLLQLLSINHHSLRSNLRRSPRFVQLNLSLRRLLSRHLRFHQAVS